jgi:hypothetical protein
LSTGDLNIGQAVSLISYFGFANHQSDSLWDFVTSFMMDNAEKLNGEHYADLIAGYAHAQRGSNQLWDHLITGFIDANNEADVSLNSKILILKSMIVVDIFDKRITDNMAREILSQETLSTTVNS